MKSYCRTTCYFIPALFLVGMNANNLLRNGSFENFSSGEPTGWTTNNIQSMLSVVSSSTNCYAGKTSVKCEVKEFYSTAMAGLISQKDIAVVDGELLLKGAYFLKSAKKDVGYIAVDVKTAGNSTIATCERYLLDATGGFVDFSVSAKLPENARRVDLLLTLMPEKGAKAVHVGSYILFDALELTVITKGSVDVQ